MTEGAETRQLPQRNVQPQLSEKSYATAVVLSGIFGVLGVQHLYLRRWGEAALDIGLTVTAVYFLAVNEPLIGGAVMMLDVLHTVIVTSLLLMGKFRDGSGKIVAYPGQFPDQPEQLPPSN